MRYIIRLAVALFSALASLAAGAEKRVALVIGNATYGHHASLPNVQSVTTTAMVNAQHLPAHLQHVRALKFTPSARSCSRLPGPPNP